MRVVVTADFHGYLPEDVPRCDLLLLAGDCLPAGGWGPGSTRHSQDPIAQFTDWLERQPAEVIVGIAGNHDFVARDYPDLVRGLPWHYLEDEGIVVDGVPVWGSPWATQFNSWAFMAPDDRLAEHWALIPDDTQILVTHGPPRGILDRVGRQSVGSHTLHSRIMALPELRLYACGHIHEGYGQTAVPRAAVGDGLDYLRCVNGAYLGRLRGGQPPIVVDL